MRSMKTQRLGVVCETARGEASNGSFESMTFKGLWTDFHFIDKNKNKKKKSFPKPY